MSFKIFIEVMCHLMLNDVYHLMLNDVYCDVSFVYSNLT